MIERIMFKQDLAYTMAIGGVIICLTIGYMLGHQPVDKVCSPYIVENDQLKQKSSELNADLTRCKAKGVGKTAFTDTAKICDERVQKALKDYKEIVCQD